MTHPYVQLQEGLYPWPQSSVFSVCNYWPCPTVATAWRGYQETSCYTRKAGKGNNPAAGLISVPLCTEEKEENCKSPTEWPPAGYWCACFWSTVRNRLYAGGMRAWHPLVQPMLTAHHCAAWLAVAREHQNWQVHHWHPVLVTVESRFTLNTYDRCLETT